jgi:hypothetical protein
VLAAKRTSYAELLERGHAEKDIAELMDRQHRTMLAAIRRGRFDEHLQKRDGSHSGVLRTLEATDGDTALEDLGQSLDEMVSEFLGAEPVTTVALQLGPGPLRAGEESEIAIRALAMPGSRPAAGAEVRVEIISPFEPPRLLASGRTDEHGQWRQPLAVPAAMAGLAALVVVVRSSMGDAEEKILL